MRGEFHVFIRELNWICITRIYLINVFENVIDINFSMIGETAIPDTTSTSDVDGVSKPYYTCMNKYHKHHQALHQLQLRPNYQHTKFHLIQPPYIQRYHRRMNHVHRVVV